MHDSIALRIHGMTCGHCVATVERTLRATPGVSNVDVQLGQGRIAVADTAERDSVIAKAITAIRDAGYSAEVDDSPAPQRTNASGCCCGSRPASDAVTLERGQR